MKDPPPRAGVQCATSRLLGSLPLWGGGCQQWFFKPPPRLIGSCDGDSGGGGSGGDGGGSGRSDGAPRSAVMVVVLVIVVVMVVGGGGGSGGDSDRIAAGARVLSAAPRQGEKAQKEHPSMLPVKENLTPLAATSPCRAFSRRRCRPHSFGWGTYKQTIIHVYPYSLLVC